MHLSPKCEVKKDQPEELAGDAVATGAVQEGAEGMTRIELKHPTGGGFLRKTPSLFISQKKKKETKR